MRCSREDWGAALAGEGSLASSGHGWRSRAPSTSEGVAAERDGLVEIGEAGKERARHHDGAAQAAAMRDTAPTEAGVVSSCSDGELPASFGSHRGQRHRRPGRGILGVGWHSIPGLAIVASLLLVSLGSPPSAAAQHYCGAADTCGNCTSMAPWNESAPESAQAHPCLGCEWMHITGGERLDLMGLYRCVNPEPPIPNHKT